MGNGGGGGPYGVACMPGPAPAFPIGRAGEDGREVPNPPPEQSGRGVTETLAANGATAVRPRLCGRGVLLP